MGKTLKRKRTSKRLNTVDIFAATALSGLLSDRSTDDMNMNDICNLAYAYGSGMLEAKERYESLKPGELIAT